MLGICLLWISKAYGQQEAPAKEALSTSPPAVETKAPEGDARTGEVPGASVAFRPSLRFGLNAGTMFGGRMGMASYLEPTAYYDLSKRFRVFGSMAYMRIQQPGFLSAETGNAPNSASFFGNTHLLMQAGGQYDANERLSLTGSVWRDFSKLPASYQPYRNPLAPGTSGMSFRADLKISDHFSISGGVRYGNGNRGNLNPVLYPYSPFGF